MSGGINSSKGENSSTSSSASSQAFDPEIRQMFIDNASRAGGIAATPFKAYTGEMVAGPGVEGQRYTDAMGGIVTDQVGGQALDAAKNAATGVSQFQSSNINASPVSAGLLRDTDLTPYMSKYTGGVIDAAMADISHQQAIADEYAKSRATSEGAWGGSGEGVLRALSGDSYIRSKGTTAANLREQGFLNAQGAATNDINRTLDAGKFNSTSSLTAQQANQAAAQQAAALRAQGAGLLGNLSDQQLTQATTRAGLLGTVADRTQAQGQAENDAQYQEFLRMLDDPLQKQQLLNQSYGLLPNQALTTSNSSSSSKGSQSSFGVSVKIPTPAG